MRITSNTRRYATPRWLVVCGALGVGCASDEPVAVTSSEPTGLYLARGVRGAELRSRIAATGALIVEAGHDYVLLEATGDEARQLEALGLTVQPADEPIQPASLPGPGSAYHSYDEMVAEIQQAAADHPAIMSLVDLGTTHEGRSIWAAKLSDHVAIDEAEPEILLTHHQHAREHLTVEQALYTLAVLTGEYGVDQRVTDLVDSREIWIVFDLNPDGGEYDVADGSVRHWRKNRQPNAGTANVGSDLNRNWGYQWGCCNGSSSSTGSETYRGAQPFSAPETAVVRDFVDSRVVGGRQQITTAIDFHSYSELILWPFGYTSANTPPDMTQDDVDVMSAMGHAMANSNGYTPEQISDLYIADGSINDWLYGAYRILNFTFELAPSTAEQGGFYPPEETIPIETARNRDAILYLLERADCPYRVIGREATHCGPGSTTTIWSDNFDGAATGWTFDPDATDQAIRGRWEIGDPEQTRSLGAVMQLGTTSSGTRALVTGRAAGASAGANDLDGGVTTARSAPIALGTEHRRITLSFAAYLAHRANSSTADHLRVTVIGATTSLVFEAVGAANVARARWRSHAVNVTAFKGQTVRLQVECADQPGESLVECGLDDVAITGAP